MFYLTALSNFFLYGNMVEMWRPPYPRIPKIIKGDKTYVEVPWLWRPLGNCPDKDYSNNKRQNLLVPLHGLLFPISSKRSVICTMLLTGKLIPRPLLYLL